MTDKEWLAQLSNMSLKELIDDAIRYSHDSYYNGIFEPIYYEIQKRLVGKNAKRYGEE